MTTKAVDIGGDCYFLEDSQPTMKLGCKSHAIFQKTFPESVYGQPAAEIERLFATYLAFADPKLDTVDVEDKPMLIALLEKRATLLRESNEYNASRLDSIQLDRYLVGIQEILQRLRGTAAKASKACKTGRTYTDEEIFLLVMELAWKLAHPETIPKDKTCEWQAMMEEMDKLELGKMVEAVRATPRPLGKPLNVLRTPPVSKIRQAATLENAMEAQADIRPQFEALLQLLVAKKYLGETTVNAFDAEDVKELAGRMADSVAVKTMMTTEGTQTTKEHTGNYASSRMTTIPKRPRPMLPKTFGTTDAPKEPSGPTEPAVAKESNESDAPKEPKDSDAPNEPKDSDAPNEPKDSDAPKEPKDSDAPNEPKETAEPNKTIEPEGAGEPTVTEEAYTAAQQELAAAQQEFEVATKAATARKTNTSKAKHAALAAAAQARIDAARSILTAYEAQQGLQGLQHGGSLSTDALYPLMTPIFDHLRSMYDPVYSVIEAFDGAISIGQLVPLLHICQQIKSYRKDPYGIYRLTGLDPAVIAFITAQIGSTKEHIARIQATNGAVEEWTADLFRLPQVSLSTVKDPLAKSMDRPAVHLARMGVNFEVGEVPARFFNTDDLYLFCTNSIPSLMMKNTDTAITQIPTALFDVDATRPQRLTPLVKTIHRSKDYANVTFEHGVLFTDAELYLRIMSLVEKVYAGVH